VNLTNRGPWRVDVFENPAAVSVTFAGVSVHVGVFRRWAWVWGYEEGWYDGPLPQVGAGPLFLVCWIWSLRESLTDPRFFK
jgi:hypothetical protein